MTLLIVEMLREEGVVGKFVEFFGPGVDRLTLADRATIANMAPEYGATCGFFPVDEATLDYLRLTGRDDAHIENVRRYLTAQGMFRTAETPDPAFTRTVELDLDTVDAAMAGPKRPQDRVSLSAMKEHFRESLLAPVGHRGHGQSKDRLAVSSAVAGADYSLSHGDLAIAAITSCTNTSNPGVMIVAGLLARNADALGISTRPWVKTSLAPGSRVVTEYYRKANLLEPLANLGFNIVGYGCTTCIGNSGPLDTDFEAAVVAERLIVSGVLSGNRNFEGRIHNNVKANYLASPPLVVAYAIAGTIDIDFETEPVATDSEGQPVFLRDIWPSDEEVKATIASCLDPETFRERYSTATKEPRWDAIDVVDAELYPWSDSSTYIRLPSFFTGIKPGLDPVRPIQGARVLLKLGDSVTTDHISPAGAIPADGPAGLYLKDHGVATKDFNSFGSRRGNHEVMMRGTFANVRIRNLVAPGTEGGWTTHFPTGEVLSVYDAAQRYIDAGTDLVVLGGEQYGTGSSRDWAAKGTLLLGVRAVITKSYERIHRSNLVGMGVLPLCFKDGEGADELGLTGNEAFDIAGLGDDISEGQLLEVVARNASSGDEVCRFEVVVRLDTSVEVEYYKNGGILQTVLRNLARK
jgi:aconitate hydratase